MEVEQGVYDLITEEETLLKASEELKKSCEPVTETPDKQWTEIVTKAQEELLQKVSTTKPEPMPIVTKSVHQTKPDISTSAGIQKSCSDIVYTGRSGNTYT